MTYTQEALEWAELAYFFGSTRRHKFTRDRELRQLMLGMMFKCKRLALTEDKQCNNSPVR
jgi:hypothetical protein